MFHPDFLCLEHGSHIDEVSKKKKISAHIDREIKLNKLNSLYIFSGSKHNFYLKRKKKKQFTLDIVLAFLSIQGFYLKCSLVFICAQMHVSSI